MQTPQLVQVDPRKIKFTAKNPRKHQGAEFERLRQSVREIGVVQLPTVRVLPGDFYECIDGEGRIRSSLEQNEKLIWVISYGIVDDSEANMMLQAANAVREFTFLSECRGLANLHRQGTSTREISRAVGVHFTTVTDYIAIGYFPDDLQNRMQQYMVNAVQDENELQLSWSTLNKVLPLREYKAGHTIGEAGTLDGVYDYREVAKVVDLVIAREIVTREQLNAYIERRRREIFEERFDKELAAKLALEMEQTRQKLEEHYAQRLEGAQKETATRYEAQVDVLNKQYKDLEAQHQRLVKEVARRPEIIEQREKELAAKLQEAAQERNRFTTLQTKLQSEIEQSKAEAAKAIRSQLDEMLAQQRTAMDAQLAETKANIESYYAQRDEQRQLKAEISVRQAVAHGTELLSQTQQSFFHLLSPGFVKGIGWLSQAEIAGLLAQIVAVQDTLDSAKQTIQDAMSHRSTVSESVIEEGSVRG